MVSWADVHQRFFAVYRPFLPWFRRRRMRLFAEAVRLTERTRVLDVGGSDYNWRWCTPHPLVTVLNIDGGDVVGDGCRLPFRDASFDVVFSNSVIEHVGGREHQARFAREVARVGQRYFVQTPNARFLVEPHLLTPLVHFLPRRTRARLARNFTLWGLIVRPSAAEAADFVDGIRLVTIAEMRRLFADAELHRERFLGLTKSLVAVR